MVDTGNSLPFLEEKIGDNIYVRTFYQNTDCGDFTWHRDREDRIIESLGFTDWKIQLDNELPKSLNSQTKIPLGVWHRIIKGNDNLRLKVVKL